MTRIAGDLAPLCARLALRPRSTREISGQPKPTVLGTQESRPFGHGMGGASCALSEGNQHPAASKPELRKATAARIAEPEGRVAPQGGRPLRLLSVLPLGGRNENGFANPISKSYHARQRRARRRGCWWDQSQLRDPLHLVGPRLIPGGEPKKRIGTTGWTSSSHGEIATQPRA